MKFNLLITGGLGYIGSFTAKNYLKKTRKKLFVVEKAHHAASYVSFTKPPDITSSLLVLSGNLNLEYFAIGFPA